MRIVRLMLACLLFPLFGVSATFAQVVERLEPRSPVALGTQIQANAYPFGVCGIELDRVGIGTGPAFPARPGEVLVGFDNTVLRGASCHHHLGTLYTGAFRFDLSDLRRAWISNATLNVAARITNVFPRTRERSFSSTCLMMLEVATRRWPEGVTASDDTTTTFPSVRVGRARSVLLASSMFPRAQSVDVTAAVQQWVFGVRPNEGFILRKPDRSIIRRDDNTDSCTNYLDLVLYITVLRRL